MSPLSLSLFSLLLFLFVNSSLSYFSNTYLINDLVKTTSTDFLNEVSAWSLSQSISTTKTYTIPSNTCNLPQTTILGGPNILGPAATTTLDQYFQRQYMGFSSTSTYIGVEFDIWAFYDTIQTSLTGTELYSVLIDNINSPITISATLENSCESIGFSDATTGINIQAIYQFHVQLFVLRSSPTLIFQLKSLMTSPSTTTSFGFRNLKMYLQSAMSTNPIISTNFPCYYGYYWTGSSCSLCHSNCQTCSGPTYNQCSLCSTNIYDYNNGTCLSTCTGPFQPDASSPFSCVKKCQTGFYWGYNQTCFDNCDAPLVQSTDGNGFAVCSNPCWYQDSTYIGKYLYPDDTCYTGCGFPLQLVDPYICITPCDSDLDFVFPNGTCIAECASPLSKATTRGIKSCESPCPTEYLYTNTTCSLRCDAPLVKVEESIFNFCKNPCADPSNSSSYTYLYTNGTCKETCPFPLASRSEPLVDYCFNPCDPLTEFLFDNGTCLDSCPFPLVTVSESNVVYCRNPCDSASFLYPNGSCLASCPSPLGTYIIPGISYCVNPCGSGRFLYSNNSCLPTCPTPNIIRSESIATYCDFPCAINEYYFPQTGLCNAVCENPPYNATEFPLPKLCTSTLDVTVIDKIQGFADTSNAANSASSVGILLGNILSSADSSFICLGPFSKMLQYIKFMDLNFPLKVQLMLAQQSSTAGAWEFANSIIGQETLDNDFPNYGLSDQFENYEMPSSFFVNFWPALFSIFVVFLVTLIFIVLPRFLKNSPRLKEITEIVNRNLKWSLLLSTFCAYFGDIVLFTATDLQTTKFANPGAVLSFVLCFSTNLIAILTAKKILNINTEIRKSLMKSRLDLENHQALTERTWSNYKCFFASYKDKSYSQQIFLFLFLVRLAIFSIAIGYLYKFPLVQACIITFANVVMILYMLIKRPFRQIVSFLQQLLLELVLLCYNICVLMFAVFDNQKIEATEARTQLGEIMIYINFVVPILCIVLVAMKLLMVAYALYKQWKKFKLPKAMEMKNSQQSLVPFTVVHSRMRKPSLQKTENNVVKINQDNSDLHTLDMSSHYNVTIPQENTTSFVGTDVYSQRFKYKRGPGVMRILDNTAVQLTESQEYNQNNTMFMFPQTESGDISMMAFDISEQNQVPMETLQFPPTPKMRNKRKKYKPKQRMPNEGY